MIRLGLLRPTLLGPVSRPPEAGAERLSSALAAPPPRPGPHCGPGGPASRIPRCRLGGLCWGDWPCGGSSEPPTGRSQATGTPAAQSHFLGAGGAVWRGDTPQQGPHSPHLPSPGPSELSRLRFRGRPSPLPPSRPPAPPRSPCGLLAGLQPEDRAQLAVCWPRPAANANINGTRTACPVPTHPCCLHPATRCTVPSLRTRGTGGRGRGMEARAQVWGAWDQSLAVRCPLAAGSAPWQLGVPPAGARPGLGGQEPGLRAGRAGAALPLIRWCRWTWGAQPGRS